MQSAVCMLLAVNAIIIMIALQLQYGVLWEA